MNRYSIRQTSIAVLVALVSALALQGCASVLTPLGEDKYDCNRKENPASPYCHSFKAVEASSNGSLPATRYDGTLPMTEFDRLTGIAPVAGPPLAPEAQPPKVSPHGEWIGSTNNSAPASSAAAPAAASMTPPLPSAPSFEGVPVRVGPLVQRVWVKRFVDSNDMLVGAADGTYVYKEISATHWAGFEQVLQNRPQTGSRAAYPHWPAQPGVAIATRPVAAASSPGAPRSAPPKFVQPGAPAPAGGMAPAPAMESGTSSMPQ